MKRKNIIYVKNIRYVLGIVVIIVLLLLIAYISGKSDEIKDLFQTTAADVQTEKDATAGAKGISYEQKRIEAMKYVPYVNVMSAAYDVPDIIEPNGHTVMLIFNPVSLDLLNVFEAYGDLYTEFTLAQSEEIDTRIRELQQKDERLS